MLTSQQATRTSPAPPSLCAAQKITLNKKSLWHMQIATRQGHNGYGKVPTQCPAELSSSLIFRFVDRIGQVKYVCQLNAKYESATQAFCGPLQSRNYLVSVANRRLTAVNSFLIRFLLVQCGFFLIFFFFFAIPGLLFI